MIKGQNIPDSSVPEVQKLDAKAYSTEMIAHLATFHHSDIHPKFSDAETVVSVGALVLGAAEKVTPVNVDMIPIMDTDDSNKVRKLSWTSIKTTLKAYFDTLYQTTLGFTPMKTDYSNAGVAPTWNQNTTGSAAKLTTPHAINGINFDGTADITINAIDSTSRAQVGGNSAQNFAANNLTASSVIAAKTISGVYMGSIGSDTYQAVVDSASYSVTLVNGAKLFLIQTGDGDGALCYTNYLSSTITILGSAGNIVNSAAPTANQIGVSKSANSAVIVIKMGSSVSTSRYGWGIVVIGSSIS